MNGYLGRMRVSLGPDRPVPVSALPPVMKARVVARAATTLVVSSALLGVITAAGFALEGALLLGRGARELQRAAREALEAR